MIKRALLVIFVLNLLGFAQELPLRASDHVVPDLLSLPAPPPSPGFSNDVHSVTNPGKRSVLTAMPAEDAPLEQLARYWAGRSEGQGAKPSSKVRERLLGAGKVYPELLPLLLANLPDTPVAYDRIKALLDRWQRAGAAPEEWRQQVSRYLMLHSRYFRRALTAAAQAAHDRDGEIEGEEEVEALARLSWPQAEPILRAHANGRSPRLRACAIALLYSHYASSPGSVGAIWYRTKLRQIVENRHTAGKARDIALDALIASEWTGRDEWYLSLFADPSLRDLTDGVMMLNPLEGPAGSDPDKWIPVLAKFVENKSRVVHDSAITVLVSFQLERARRDALLPLLPWLFDPKWSSARDRLRLIQSMEYVDIPESIPGLIAVLDQDDPYDRSYAAESVAHYRDSRAVPALRRALEREKEWDHRRRIIQALISCGGLSDDEVAGDIAAYAEKISNPQDKQEVEAGTEILSDKPLSVNVSLGAYLAESSPPSELAIRLLLDQSSRLRESTPQIPATILRIIDRWPSKAADQDLVRRISSGEADAGAIHAALLKRDSLRSTVQGELHVLESVGGARTAIAAVILCDHLREIAILGGDDTGAQTALLACARLVREPLDTASVGHLLESRNALLARAAEAYLIGDDGAQARQLVLARHASEAMLIGARQEFDPGHNTYAAFDHLENYLRGEVRRGIGPNEIFALLSAGYWGDAGQVIVYIEHNAGKISYEGQGKRVSRELSADDIAHLRSFILENRVEDLGPLTIRAFDGMQYEYIHLTKDGGRRVFMNNPGFVPGSTYDRVCDFFRHLIGVADTGQRSAVIVN